MKELIFNGETPSITVRKGNRLYLSRKALEITGLKPGDGVSVAYNNKPATISISRSDFGRQISDRGEVSIPVKSYGILLGRYRWSQNSGNFIYQANKDRVRGVNNANGLDYYLGEGHTEELAREYIAGDTKDK